MGRVADVYGRKKTFVAGALWLAVFAFGCGFAKGLLTFFSLNPSFLSPTVTSQTPSR